MAMSLLRKIWVRENRYSSMFNTVSGFTFSLTSEEIWSPIPFVVICQSIYFYDFYSTSVYVGRNVLRFASLETTRRMILCLVSIDCSPAGEIIFKKKDFCEKYNSFPEVFKVFLLISTKSRSNLTQNDISKNNSFRSTSMSLFKVNNRSTKVFHSFF